MFKIYVNTDIEYVECNDFFFNKYTYDKVLEEKRLQDVIERVEGCKYLGDGQILSKFTNSAVDMSLLSTGVKTLLNIMSFPDKVFLSSECGINVTDEFFSLSEGSVYSNYIISPFELDDGFSCEFIFRDKSVVCHSDKEIWGLMNSEV